MASAQSRSTWWSIARHLRDEAGQMLDAEFNIEGQIATVPGAVPPAPTISPESVQACCTPTAKGNACC